MKLIIDIPQGMIDAFSHEAQWTAVLCRDMNNVLQNGIPLNTISDDVMLLYKKYQPRLATNVYEFGIELNELLRRYER